MDMQTVASAAASRTCEKWPVPFCEQVPSGGPCGRRSASFRRRFNPLCRWWSSTWCTVMLQVFMDLSPVHNATRTPKTNASVLNYAATHDRMCKHTRAQEYQPIVAENEHHLFVIVALRRPASPHSCGAVCFVTRRCQNRAMKSLEVQPSKFCWVTKFICTRVISSSS